MSSSSDRARLLTVSAGTNAEAFRASDWGLLGAVALTWGASFLFIRIGLDAFSPYLVAFLRISLGAVTLACVPAARGRIDRSDWGRVVLLAVIWMALPLTLFPLAEQHVNSALAGMLNGGMPILTAVVATALGLRRPGRVQIIGLAVGFAGVVLISADSFQIGGDQAFGVLLIFGALICYAFSANLAVPLQQRYGGPALMLRVEAVGAVLTAPMAAWGLRSSHFAWRPLLAVMVLGIVGTGAAFAVMASLLGRVGATRGSIVTYLMPPVSIVLGVVVRDDHIAWLSVVGMGVVLVGAVLVSRKEAPPIVVDAIEALDG
ncbi:MAG: DMT family transporter [Acidimicrobiales bacterium]